VLVVWSFTLETGSDAYYRWIQPGFAMAMLAVPLFMLGIVVLLPPPKRSFLGVKRVFLGLSAIGLGITGVAIVGFLWAYPDNWYDYGETDTLIVMLVYAFGTGLIAVATGFSLREHAPELIQTVTQINQPDPVEESDDAGGTEESSIRSISVEGGSLDPSEAVTLVINGESYTFGDGDTFGRRDEEWLDDLKMACDGHEEIPYVSSDHLEFTVENGDVYVEDNSRNGTKLNGRDLDGDRAALSDGDTLVLADRAKIDVQL